MFVWKQLSPSVEHRLALGPAFGMTDIGTARPSNEDNFLIDPALGLIAIADGMGGHEGGEVASNDALVAMASYLHASQAEASGESGTAPSLDASAHCPLTTVHYAVEFANQRMYQANVDQRRIRGRGMGTTLTGLWQPVAGAPAVIFHVGDTRLYRLREGRLERLTRDQTLYQDVLDSGATALHLPPRNLLMQALGPDCAISPELQSHVVFPGDLFMLCSDGLHGAIDDDTIACTLAAVAPDDLGATCAELIDMAKRDGSRDNITVVLFQCRH